MGVSGCTGPLQPKLSNRCSIYILTSSLDLSDTVRMKDYPIVSDLIHKPIKSGDIQFKFFQYS